MGDQLTVPSEVVEIYAQELVRQATKHGEFLPGARLRGLTKERRNDFLCEAEAAVLFIADQLRKSGWQAPEARSDV